MIGRRFHKSYALRGKRKLLIRHGFFHQVRHRLGEGELAAGGGTAGALDAWIVFEDASGFSVGSVKISVTGWQSVTSVAWSAVCENLLGIVFPHLEKGWWNRCAWKSAWCGSKAALGAVRCLRIAAFPRVGSSAGIGGARLMLPWAGVRWSSTCRCVGLPPGREKEPVGVWLASHPGIKVICLHGSAPMPRRPVQGLRAPCRLCRPVAFVDTLATAVERTVIAHRPCLLAPEPTAPASRRLAAAPPSTVNPDTGVEKWLVTRTRERHKAVH